ncbi:hypothetical protein E2562_035699 [Oryza meyeriana var. granulata]|uniref:Uncharacterized protein n=1 Tax=Oryza meyeriana var. granulata TaxID=110450 RepID=A0A6G1C1Y5_9ORYZ|nr:hypothetical protein E2562_035699 [Oryza meyeriana var. granulata]
MGMPSKYKCCGTVVKVGPRATSAPVVVVSVMTVLRFDHLPATPSRGADGSPATYPPRPRAGGPRIRTRAACFDRETQ